MLYKDTRPEMDTIPGLIIYAHREKGVSFKTT